MLRSLSLTDVGPAQSLSIDLGPRLNVMTGDNGLGKSFVLEILWWVLSGTWAGLPAWPRADAKAPQIAFTPDEGPPQQLAFVFQTQQWRKPLQKSPALVLYARADGGFSIWDPARNRTLRQGNRRVPSLPRELQQQVDPTALRRPAAYDFDAREVMDGKEYKGKTICNGLIRDWVNWQEKTEDSVGGTAFQHLCRTLEALSPAPQGAPGQIRPGKPIRLFVDDTREFPTIDSGYGEIPILFASAGMKRIISLAYLIVWAWHEHLEASRILRRKPVKSFVLLMDEAENHLHPDWARRIVPALLRVLEGLASGMQVQACITTHAPLVLASLEPHFDPDRDRLFVFDLEEGAVVLRHVPWARYGDASRWLTSPALNLGRARSPEAEIALDDAWAVIKGEAPRTFKTIEEVDRALHDALPGQDPFWPRWLVFTGQVKR